MTEVLSCLDTDDDDVVDDDGDKNKDDGKDHEEDTNVLEEDMIRVVPMLNLTSSMDGPN
jgi:hypothetical protein